MLRMHQGQLSRASNLIELSLITACPSLQSVSFSGPGWVHSKDQFGSNDGSGTEIFPDVSDAHKLATIFMPSKDLVPRIDKHVGNIHDIECPYNDPFSCHSMNGMVCELLNSCGDDGTNRIKTCTPLRSLYK